MDKKIEQILRNRADFISKWMQESIHLPHNSDFNGNSIVRVQKPTDGEIGFEFAGDRASVWFRQIQPGKVISTNLHPPSLLNKKKNDSSTTTILNDSDSVVERTYDFGVESTRSRSVDVGAEVSAGFEQKISYGGAASPVSGETSFSLDVTASYNENTSTSTSTSRNSTTTVECPPRTKMYITSESSIANYEQKMDVNGSIEHQVQIWSHGECSFIFNSWQGFCDMLHGRANDDVYTWDDTHDKEYQGLAAKFRNRVEWYNPFLTFTSKIPTLHYQHKTVFQDAVVGDVRVTSEPIT